VVDSPRPGRAGPVGEPGRPSPATLPAAQALFGERLGVAAQYAELLATDGVVRGLIGPREAPRIWDRHLLNCAAMAELIEPGAAVVDVGSGAGLPGLVLAIARPDLSVVLVEPMARRTAFLTEVVSALGLAESVPVIRARAEEVAGQLPGGPADVVTARAVAPLDRLAGWCLPLAKVGGRLLAIKGASAAEEVAAHAAAVRRLGGAPPVVRVCGADLLDPATTVVEVVRERATGGTPEGRGATRPSTSDGVRARSSARRR
jgi:16S rRNA (guanine527-N7)-methyltransferase